MNLVTVRTGRPRAEDLVRARVVAGVRVKNRLPQGGNLDSVHEDARLDDRGDGR